MTRSYTADTVRCCAAAALTLLAAAASPARAAAQQVATGLLPDSVAERIVAFYNRELTTRMIGDARIGAGTAMRGDVAVLAGTLSVDGIIEGDVVVINGHLAVGSGGRISGRATVAGGDVRIATDGAVDGGTDSYREPLRYRFFDDRIAYVPAEHERGLSAGLDLPFGRTDILVAVHGAYNRVEGLPVAIGPRVRFGGTYPTTARALLVARTASASELDPRRLGYEITAEQLVAPAAGVTLGLRLFSEVVPIETGGLSDRESGLATFLLHQDHRDHYEREGWSVHARLERPGAPYTVELQYRDEEHESRRPANPFTVLDHGRSWRRQPAVAEGALRSVSGVLRHDTRNEDRDPSAGWLSSLRIERGLGGTLVGFGAPAEGTEDAVVREERTSFLTGSIDVRRYARLSPYTRVAIRIATAGSLDGRALPPQRQHALGGEGTLPGYRVFEFDCGARDGLIDVGGRAAYPYYGCDRMALVQLEYQANFPIARRVAESAGLGAVGNLVRWVAFFDAGRAWTEPRARNGRLGGSDDFSADAGIGLRVGPLGAYWAVPLSGRGQGFNFFVRLGPRL